jgi:hypothetical protein
VRDANANVIMISQASSEHSVCFAVKQAEGERAVRALNKRCAPPGAAGAAAPGMAACTLSCSSMGQTCCARAQQAVRVPRGLLPKTCVCILPTPHMAASGEGRGGS